MLMPGFSNQRVPLNVRLFVAFSITLALTPLLASEIQKSLSGIAPVAGQRVVETIQRGLIGGDAGRKLFS
jgi:flagellar biosynthetic protein FliR